MRRWSATPNAVVLLAQPFDDRELYAQALRERGYLPVLVSASGDALRVAPLVDIIVTEILLPGRFDGVEFSMRLKADDRTRKSPVIVLSACTWQSERDRAMSAGCDAFLEKPCRPDVLAGEIRRLLAR